MTFWRFSEAGNMEFSPWGNKILVSEAEVCVLIKCWHLSHFNLVISACYFGSQ